MKDLTKIVDSLRQFAEDKRDRGWKHIADDLDATADLIEREAAQTVQPFGYLRQTTSDRNPPHGWALHFHENPGDVAVYLRPPLRRMPEPMTDEEIYDNDEIMSANCYAGLMFEDFSIVVRIIEAAVLRRVREANK